MIRLSIILLGLLIIGCSTAENLSKSQPNVQAIITDTEQPGSDAFSNALEMGLLLNFWAYLDKEDERLSKILSEDPLTPQQKKIVEDLVQTVRSQRTMTWQAVFEIR